MQILGDKKRVRYDEGLVDVVNAKYAEQVVIAEESALSREKDFVVTSGFEVFEGKPYVELMPKIVDKELILGMNGIMKRRVSGSDEDKTYFRNNYFDTVDDCACASDGRFKIVYDCEILKGVNPKSVLVNGALILEDGVYELLRGIEFSSGDRKHTNRALTETKAKKDPFWLAFARNDQELLDQYVEKFFKFLKDNYDENKGMNVFLPGVPEVSCLRAWCLGGFGDDCSYGFRSGALGGCSLDYVSARLVRVVAPEAQK